MFGHPTVFPFLDNLVKTVKELTGHPHVYAVGGCVRDLFMGKKPEDLKDVDLVIIGVTPEYLLNKGFVSIGKKFPVFTHPTLKGIELAIARGEEKDGPKHTDFRWWLAESLYEDLYRRDLTINAIAYNDEGFVDPFFGRQDIIEKKLRIIGPAFSDDALRVFRVARFASQLSFNVLPVTYEAMRAVKKEDIRALPLDRVREEMFKALDTRDSASFFKTLWGADQLDVWFPELSALIDVPAGPLGIHIERDSFVHTIFCLEHADIKNFSPTAKLMALVHDFGKAETPKEMWPHHYKHEEHVEPIEKFCKRFRLSKNITNKLVTHTRWHMHPHRIFEMRRPGKIFNYWTAVKKFFGDHLDASICDHFGRLPTPKDYAEYDLVIDYFYCLYNTVIPPGCSVDKIKELYCRALTNKINEKKEEIENG